MRSVEVGPHRRATYNDTTAAEGGQAFVQASATKAMKASAWAGDHQQGRVRAAALIYLSFAAASVIRRMPSSMRSREVA